MWLPVYHHRSHRYRAAQQVEDGFGEVYPLLERHAFALGEVWYFFMEWGGVNEACTSRELMRGDVVEGGVHDVVAEVFTRAVGGSNFEVDVGEQFYDLAYGQG